MTNLPPSDPRRTDARRDRDLGFDELLAIVVAFGALGTVFWWGLRNTEGLNMGGLFPSAETANSRSPGSPFDSLLTSPEDGASQASGITAAVQGNGQINGQLPSGVVSPTPNFSAPNSAQPIAPVPPTAVVPAIVPAPVPAVSPASPPVAIDTAPPPALVVPPPIASPVEFSDVPQDYWARPFIAALAQRGIIKGFADGTFQPDQPVSRSQYAALIETIFQSQTVQNPIAFKDVAAGFWASPAIDTAVRTGFLKGYPEGIFQPEQPIPRIQVLTSLVNGLQISQPSSPADVVKRYRDSDEIPAWAVPVAAAATQKGMVVNYPEQAALNPKQPATRAEVAALLYQALVAAGKIDPIQSSYIVQP
jgi:S-layer homology domain